MSYKIQDQSLLNRVWLTALKTCRTGATVRLECASKKEAIRFRFQLNLARKSLLREHPELETLTTSIEDRTVTVSATFSDALLSAIMQLEGEASREAEGTSLTENDLKKMLQGD
ncbi:MAG: hypothetical protein DA330_00805 [Nitrososphaera sp.]|nr:hypothetical protein [Nitrososphaera sp.]